MTVHPLADVQSPCIGEGTRIWQFVVILPGAVIGRNCNFCAQVFVENDVTVGDRVTVKNCVQLWDGITLEDDVFIGPNVAFTNDPFPRSGRHPEAYARTTVKKGASIGANATILPGLTLGENCLVAAGSVVTRDVPAGKLAMGNPARVVGDADAWNPANPNPRQ